MTTRIMQCSIAVGCKSRNPRAKIDKLTKDSGAFLVSPWGFLCIDCQTEWGDTAISVSTDIRTVSCSNCYSDRVVLTAVRLTIPDAADFATDDEVPCP